MIAGTNQIKVADISKLNIFENKRNCYSQIEEFITNNRDSEGKLCALYGLRRTGKTVLLSQAAHELSNKGHKCLYLVCSDERQNKKHDQLNEIKHVPQITELFEILNEALKQEYEYVFIDEITFIEDFVGQGNLLSNYYTKQGLTFILTGTDSLSFILAQDDDLYDRLKPIRTSYISYEEYNRLLGKTLDEYIQYGGTLKEESPYKDGSSTIQYTNTAIVNNIIHSIQGSETSNLSAITLQYEDKDIASVIHRCINQMNQDFLVSAINKNNGYFKSHPFHLGLNNSKNFPFAAFLDIPAIDEQVKESLAVLNKNEFSKNFTQEDIDIIKKALRDLDLILPIPTYLSVKENPPVFGKEMQIISQPGMIYCHATELIKILTDNQNWHELEQCGEDNKEAFIRRIDKQVKGDILENLILFDTYQALGKNYYVTKIRRKQDSKEVDVVATDKKTKDTYLFEVKYADFIDESDQTKNLSNREFMNYISERFGQIKGRFVIYNGQYEPLSDGMGDIHYVSAEDYLKNVVHSDNIPQLLTNILDAEKNIHQQTPTATHSLNEEVIRRINDFAEWAAKQKETITQIVAKEYERIAASLQKRTPKIKTAQYSARNRS